MKHWMIAAAFLLLPVHAQAQEHTLPDAPHLLVKGHAQGRYVPDRFSIHLQVEVTDMVPEQARRRVEAHMQKIFAALDKYGALRKRTQASSLQIQPDTDYRDNKKVFNGTEVTRTVQATFDSLEKLRAFIAQLPADQEVQISGTDVSRSDMESIRLKLRKQAIVNSQQAAKRIAAAYGMKVNGVYSVSEVAPDFAYGIKAGFWNPSQFLGDVMVSANALPDADLRAGSIDVEQDIYAVYLTQP